MSTGPRDPADEHEVENRLRAALGREADGVVPAYRLEEIRAETGRSSPGRLPQWVPPVGAAAAVAVVALLVWLGVRPGTTTPVPVGTVAAAPSTAATTGTRPTAGSTSVGSPTGGTSVPNGGATAAVALPVFRIQSFSQGAKVGKWQLVREFASTKVSAPDDLNARITAALDLALSPSDPNPNGFVSAWPAGTTVQSVSRNDPEIRVILSNPGKAGFTTEQQQMAVQQLVWTATAVAQQSAPVFIGATGGVIFESVPANVFKRPADARLADEIAPIWVDNPSAGQTVAATARVVVTGQACVFEATVGWQLRQGAAVVRKGFTTASSGCPQQGSWSVDLGTLAPGDYTFVGIESSAADGSVASQLLVPFRVS
ncbi:Gmad2 immunoglobulin-like domain-containing protein [Lapillicoccus sp.]|uniref:Gmad2 immunoglobulin-like domain-containing protein n=1 Tax=Lapillicoccus sp. TaxID=1909287 RepID=UPI0032647449